MIYWIKFKLKYSIIYYVVNKKLVLNKESIEQYEKDLKDLKLFNSLKEKLLKKGLILNIFEYAKLKSNDKNFKKWLNEEKAIILDWNFECKSISVQDRYSILLETYKKGRKWRKY